MQNPEPPTGWAPSGSTGATGAAGALASIVIYVASLKGITFPAGIECAIGVLFATIAGYFPKSGRQ